MDYSQLIPKPKKAAINDESAFCALCLRQRRSNGFFGYHIGANSKFRKLMDSVLGIQLHLDHFYTCKSCLKLVQLMQDFRMCCTEANEKLKLYEKGIVTGDKWFSGRTAQTIENVRVAVVTHTESVRKIGESVSVVVKVEPVDEQKNVEIPEGFVRVEVEEPEEEAESEYLDFTQEMVSDMVEGEINIEEDDDDEMDFSTWIRSTDEAEGPAEELPKIELSECSRCQRTFDSNRGLKMHLPHCREEVDNQFKLKCPICPITFKYPALLKNHMNKHEGKTPYKCRKQCDRSFAGNVNRYIHEMQCAKEPQKCPICSCDLKSKRALNDHMIGSHGEPKFVCGECGMKFRRRTVLTQHRVNVHRASILKVQQAGTIGQSNCQNVEELPRPKSPPSLPFRCNECGKGFTHMPLMLYHKRRMHPA